MFEKVECEGRAKCGAILVSGLGTSTKIKKNLQKLTTPTFVYVSHRPRQDVLKHSLTTACAYKVWSKYSSQNLLVAAAVECVAPVVVAHEDWTGCL